MIAPNAAPLPVLVYQVTSSVGTRTLRDVGESSRTGRPSSVFHPGELVCVDLREKSVFKGSTNGPFLRLADYTGGWLFERKNGQRVMTKIASKRGLWAFKVVNEVGIALRRHPIDCADRNEKMMVDPSVVYPPGYIVVADVKVVSSKGVEFYRVQGTSGWVFRSRGNCAMMEPMSLEKAHQDAVRVQPPRKVKCEFALDLKRVRALAQRCGLKEIQLNEKSRVVAFRKDVFSGSGLKSEVYKEHGSVRINVYYTTGTVGTSLLHPKQGRTQLFRRNCTMNDVREVFNNPRWHSGRGYQRRTIQEDKVVACQVEKSRFSDEGFALRQSLFQLDSDIQDLIAARQVVLDRMREAGDERLAVAHRKYDEKVAQKKREEGERKRKLEQEKEAEEERRRKKERALVRVAHNLIRTDGLRLNDETDIVAIGGIDCALAVDRDHEYYYTAGMPRRLHELLHTRARHHPHPTMVVMGSDDRFYIEFSNGKAEWRCNNPELGDILRNEEVDEVAFGSDTYTYVVLASGRATWNGDIPARLHDHLMSNRSIIKVSLGPDRQWFVKFADGSFAGGGFGPEVNKVWQARLRNGDKVHNLVFGEYDTFIMLYSYD